MEIEQAFEKVAPGTKNVGRFQYLIYSCVCFVQILLACQMCLLVVLEPYLTQPESTYVQLTKEECSKATSIFQLGVLVGNLIIGSVTDSFGRKRPFFAFVPAHICLQIVGTFITTKNAFYCYRLASGFITGTLTVISFVYGQEILPKTVWALTGNVMPFVFALGIACLAFAGQVLTSAQDIILWTSAPFLVCSLLTYHAPESPRWLLAKGDREGAARVFNHLAHLNGKLDHQEPVLKRSQPGPATSIFFLAKPYLRGRLVKMMLLWFTASLCYYGLTLNLSSLHSNPNVSLCLSGLVEVPAYVASFYMMESPRFGRKKSTAFFYAGNTLACGLVSVAFVINYTKMVLPLALLGKLFGAAAFTMVYIWGAELFPTDIRSSGLACASVTARLGGIIVPQFPQLLSDTLSYAVFAGFAAASTAVSLNLPETLDRQLPSNCAELERQYQQRHNDVDNDREPLLADS